MNRMMRGAAVDEDQEKVRRKYVAKSSNMYTHMARQDCMEQLQDMGLE